MPTTRIKSDDNSPDPFQIPSYSSISSNSSGLTLYDSVEVFPSGQSGRVISSPLLESFIYFFEFETYTPYTETIEIDFYATSPSGRIYHCVDYFTKLNNTNKKLFFEFGAAETGDYNFSLIVDTASPVNLHIFIEQFQPLTQYYTQLASEITPLNPILNSDIHQFGSNDLSHTYSTIVQEDVCYMVNFFLVSPICKADLLEMDPLDRPIIKMTFQMNETEYAFYPDLPITQYALLNNLESFTLFDIEINLDSGPILENSSFLIRFGSAITGELTMNLEFSEFWPFDANYAFIFYKERNIGNGPDDENPITNPTSDEMNDSINTAVNNTDEIILPKRNFDQILNDAYHAVQIFCIEHFWILIGIGGLILGISYSLYQYFTLTRIHLTNLKYVRENERSEGDA